MQPENILLKKIQEKDEGALSTLYDNYAPALYGVIIRMCRDEQNAQNILQDTFMTIWEKSHQFDPTKGKFYTWAYRIAKNKTLNFIRQSSKLIQTEELGVYTNEEDSIKIEPEYLQLTGCLKQLDIHHQKALELIYFNGLTHREAHKVMNVPLGTFKSYVKQAIRDLKTNYDKFVIWTLIFMETIK